MPLVTGAPATVLVTEAVNWTSSPAPEGDFEVPKATDVVAGVTVTVEESVEVEVRKLTSPA